MNRKLESPIKGDMEFYKHNCIDCPIRNVPVDVVFGQQYIGEVMCRVKPLHNGDIDAKLGILADIEVYNDFTTREVIISLTELLAKCISDKALKVKT